MENHINIHAFDGSIPKDWNFPNQWSVHGKAEERKPVPLGVAPKSTTNGQALSVAVDVLDEIIAGNKALYMWGSAQYEDVFPNTKHHVTRFAVQIIAGGDPRNPEKMSFSYSFLAKHNCSDEECDRQGFPADWTAPILEIK